MMMKITWFEPRFLKLEECKKKRRFFHYHDDDYDHLFKDYDDDYDHLVGSDDVYG